MMAHERLGQLSQEADGSIVMGNQVVGTLAPDYYTAQEAAEVAGEIVRRWNAAPDLLAACEQFVRIAENGRHPNWARYMKTGAGEKMRAAIKKARGE